MEELASGENMPLLQNGSPIFEWAPGVAIDDEDVTYEDLYDANTNDERS